MRSHSVPPGGLRRVCPISGTRKASEHRLAARIERWFAGNARPLPWRRRRTGWRALVSEVMLQQTQVSRVEERFERFMSGFPTPRALARASEQAVLAAWQGMGYYRRAVLLHRAAQAIVERHAGRVPRDAATLAQLPGVGRYTAGAVASIVHGERVPIVDGNVARVLLRVHGRALPLRDARAQRWCWREAESLVQACRDPARLNEGLMELGATLCTPVAPRCGRCPLRGDCAAHERSAQERIPAPPTRRSRPRVILHALALTRADAVFLEQRPQTGMWPGLWQSPSIEATRALSAASFERAIRDRLDASGALRAAVPLRLAELEAFDHGTTHRDVHVRVFVVKQRANRLRGDAAAAASSGRRVARDAPFRSAPTRGSSSRMTPARWVSRRSLASIPLSSLAKRVLSVVDR